MNHFLEMMGHFKNTPLVWAQGVHFLISYAVMLTLYREGQRRRFWIAILVIAAVAAVIECWFDVVYEPDPIWPGGITDWTFYMLGAFVGAWIASRKFKAGVDRCARCKAAKL
jgi:4-amino-4-deoxy-L-arabinose transferase-like glycosyltransferase